MQDAKNWLLAAHWNSSISGWENVSPAVIGHDSITLLNTASLSQTDFSDPEFALALPRTIDIARIVQKNVSCYAGSDGSIIVGLQDSVTPVNYVWKDSVNNILRMKIDGVLGDTLSGIPAGDYL